MAEISAVTAAASEATVPEAMLNSSSRDPRSSMLSDAEHEAAASSVMAMSQIEQRASFEEEEDEEDDEDEEEDDDAGGAAGAAGADDDNETEGGSAKRSKLSRELPPEAVAVFKSWLLSEKNFSHPEQERLLSITGLGKRQLKNWFTNARRRIWKPLVVQRLKALNKPMAFASDADGDGGMQRFDAERIFSLKPSARGAEVGGPGASGRMMRYVGFSPFEAVKQPSSASLSAPVGPGDDDNLLVTIAESENPGRAHAFEVPNETFSGPNPAATKMYRTILTSATAVASDARCLICAEDAVDSQLMPCRHLLHATCLRMWMQPKHGAAPEDVRNYNTCCPICSVGITCVVLAVPCVENTSSNGNSMKASASAAVSGSNNPVGGNAPASLNNANTMGSFVAASEPVGPAGAAGMGMGIGVMAAEAPQGVKWEQQQQQQQPHEAPSAGVVA